PAIHRAPPKPPPRPLVVGLSLGEKTTCLELKDGRFRCWGALSVAGAVRGALQVFDREVCTRDGAEERCYRPNDRIRVRRSPFVEIETGASLCARDTEGGVWCWMSREPDENTQLTPIPLEGAATALAVTGLDTCALTESGTVACFDPVMHVLGFHHSAQIAGTGVDHLDGSYLQQCFGGERGIRCRGSGGWRPIRGVGAPRLLTVGKLHACAVDDERVYCWGDNRHDQRNVPLLDASLVIDLDAGDDHTCALLFGGSVRCWGSDTEGQVSAPCEAGLCD
ncbi:MAG TPA: hypothetical protein ENK18_02205, partial [Deltaproteobacteria bacterium]|nr:hypothetical protein [Deltaproteobacteria bacterium]